MAILSLCWLNDIFFCKVSCSYISLNLKTKILKFWKFCYVFLLSCKQDVLMGEESLKMYRVTGTHDLFIWAYACNLPHTLKCPKCKLCLRLRPGAILRTLYLSCASWHKPLMLLIALGSSTKVFWKCFALGWAPRHKPQILLKTLGPIDTWRGSLLL